MTRRSILAVSTVVLWLQAGAASAVPVAPIPQTVTQPDGTTLTVRPVGDEFNVFWELPSGHTVVSDAHGWWRLATVDAAGRLVPRMDLVPGDLSAAILRNVPRHVRPHRAGHAPGELTTVPVRARASTVRSLEAASGYVPVLVILIEFNDRAPLGASAADFQAAFFGSGKSVAQYYHEATFGKLETTPVADTYGTAGDGIVGWIKLNMNHPNRGISGSSSASEQQKRDASHNTRLAVKAAIEAADAYVDFSAYDADGNGGLSRDEIGVVIITAGWESSYGGYKSQYSPANWGHRWVLDGNDGVGVVSAPLVDGVRVAGYLAADGGYSSFGEWMQSNPTNGHRSTIGVMVHELGHDILGLPDLYDTDSSSEGIGAWGLMGGGSWGSDNGSGAWSGDTPVLLCAWSRAVTSIVTPTDLSGAGTATAHRSGIAGELFRIGTGTDSEYFLLEYRRPVGWDAGLRRFDATFATGGGLAIWHVDETRNHNDDEAHKHVDLEEANGLNYLDNNVSQAQRSMLFYGGATTAFDDATSPSATRYDGMPSGVVISNVGTAEEDTITFDFTAPNPVGFGADGCETAFDVVLAPGEERALSEVLAQAFGGDTPPLCAPISATGWFRVVPQRTGKLTVDTSGSNFDTVAAILAGSCASPTVLACNDDIVLGQQTASRIVDLAVQRDVPVWVVIGAYGSGSGSGGTLGGKISLAAANPLTVSSSQAAGCPRLEWTVSVNNGGSPVTGLSASELTLLIDGTEVSIATVTDQGGGSYRVVSYGLVGGSSATHTLRLEIDSAATAGEIEVTVEETGTACAGVTEATQTLIIPAAAHLVGAKGTNWRTDLLSSVAGTAGGWADVEISYLAHGQANPSPERRVVAVANGGASYGDAASTLFGVGAGKGALLIRWRAEQADATATANTVEGLRVTSRTYNLLGADNEMGLPAGSTFGQEIPAVPLDSAIPAGGEAWITGLVHQAGGDRTNVGLVAVGDQGATVDLTFTGPTGETLLTRSVTLAGWEYLQVDNVMGGVTGGVVVASVHIEVDTGGDAVVVYASVVDGLTGDPVALLMEQSPASIWYVPSAAHVTGVNDTNWRTDVAIANTSDSAVSVVLTFLEEGKDNSAATPATPIVLPTGGTTRISNVLPTVFNRFGVKGALKVTADSPVVVASRTYNLLLGGNRWNLPEGATFGQNIPAVSATEGIAAGEQAIIPGVARNASYRSNLAFLNMSSAAVTVEVRVIASNGGEAGSAVNRVLRPYEAAQINDIVAAAGVTGDLLDGSVVLQLTDGAGPVAVFLSGVDNRTGDPVTRMAQR